MSACQRCQASSVESGITYCPRPRFFSCPSFAICEHISLTTPSFISVPLALSLSVITCGPSGFSALFTTSRSALRCSLIAYSSASPRMVQVALAFHFRASSTGFSKSRPSPKRLASASPRRLFRTRAPLTVARCVIHFGPESQLRGFRFLALRVGVGRRNRRLHWWVGTPPRKFRRQFQEYKHTSLSLLR